MRKTFKKEYVECPACEGKGATLPNTEIPYHGGTTPLNYCYRCNGSGMVSAWISTPKKPDTEKKEKKLALILNIVLWLVGVGLLGTFMPLTGALGFGVLFYLIKSKS